MTCGLQIVHMVLQMMRYAVIGRCHLGALTNTFHMLGFRFEVEYRETKVGSLV